MTILAVDASSRARAVVVIVSAAGDLIEGHVLTGAPAGHSLPAALAQMDLGALEAVVAALGPGSHTGLRTGMALALGVAHARGLPLHGVGALEVIAHASRGDGEICAVADAGRGGVFHAGFRREGGAVTETAAPGRSALLEFVAAPGALLLGFDSLDLPDLSVASRPDQALASAAVAAVRTRRPANLAEFRPVTGG